IPGGAGISCVVPGPVYSDTIIIRMPPMEASVSIVASDTAICSGDPVEFVATPTYGGTAPTYQWFINNVEQVGMTNDTLTTATLNDADSIYVVMTAGGSASSCVTGSPATSAAIHMEVTQSFVASVSITASQDTICLGEQVILEATPVNAGTVPTFQWFINGAPQAGEN